MLVLRLITANFDISLENLNKQRNPPTLNILNLLRSIGQKKTPAPIDVGNLKTDLSKISPKDVETLRHFGATYSDLQKIIGQQTQVQQERYSLYRELQQASSHWLISSAIQIYTDASCNPSSYNNKTIWIKSDTKKYQTEGNQLLESIAIEDRIFDWVHALALYGDLFIKPYCQPGYGVLSVDDSIHPADVGRIEWNGRLVGFYQQQVSDNSLQQMLKTEMVSPWLYVHGRVLGSNMRRLHRDKSGFSFASVASVNANVDGQFSSRYGVSVAYDALPSYKRLRLAEDCLLLARVSKGVKRYVWKLAIPNNTASPQAVAALVEEVKILLKRTRNLDVDSGSAKYNDVFCLRGDTKIRLLNRQSVAIKSIADNEKDFIGKYVYAVDPATQRTTVDKIVGCKLTRKNATLIRVYLDNDQYVDCTSDHLFMLRDGCYKEAKELLQGESLMPLYTKLSNITDKLKRRLKGYELVYDCKTHRWFYTHRLVETAVHGCIKYGYAVHHKDFNKLNNDPSNLVAMHYNAHWKLHSKLGGYYAKTILQDHTYEQVYGKKIAKKRKLQLSESQKRAWSNKKQGNAHITYEEMYGIEKAAEIRYKLKISHKNQKCWFKGLSSNHPGVLKMRLSQSRTKRRKIKLGIYKTRSKIPTELRICKFDECKKEFIVKINHDKQFCSAVCVVKHFAMLKRLKRQSEMIDVICACGCKKEFSKHKNSQQKFIHTHNLKSVVHNKRNVRRIKDILYMIRVCQCGCKTTFKCEAHSKVRYIRGHFLRTRRILTESRVCACGCDEKFQCKVNSRQIYKLNHFNYVRWKLKNDNLVLNHKVVAIKVLDYTEDTYDLQTEKYHNFALDAGIFVHNSQLNIIEDVIVPVFGDANSLTKEELGGECLRGTTAIRLLDGEQPTIKEMVDNPQQYIGKDVYACTKDGKVVARRIKNVLMTRPQTEFVRVHLDNKQFFDVTPDHPCMLRNGKFEEAQNLKNGQSLMPLYTRNSTLKNNKVCKTYEQFYDPITNDWHFTHHRVAKECLKQQYDDVYKKLIETGKEKFLVIHHKDFNKYNNDSCNLQWMGEHEHWLHHSQLIKDLNCHRKGKTFEEMYGKDRALILKNNIRKTLIKANYVRWSKLNKKQRSRWWSRTIGKSGRVVKHVIDCECNYCKCSSGEIKSFDAVKIRTCKYCNLLLGNIKQSEYLNHIQWNCSNHVRTERRPLTSEHKQKLSKNSKGRVWVCDVKTLKEKFVKSDEVLSYLSHGFMKGRAFKADKILNHKVVRVEKLNIIEDAYDLVIEDAYDKNGGPEHCFALSCGVFVHNTDVKWIADIEEFRRQAATALRIPMSILPGFSGDVAPSLGNSSAETFDIRFSRQSRRLQHATVNAVKRLCQIHFAFKGMDPDPSLFDVCMNETSVAEEAMQREVLEKGSDVVEKMSDLIIKTVGEEKINRVKLLNYLNKKLLKFDDLNIEEFLLPGFTTDSPVRPLIPTAAVESVNSGDLYAALPKKRQTLVEGKSMQVFDNPLWHKKFGTAEITLKIT